MTQVKSYRMGSYIWVNGKLVYKQHNRTYRQQPTKYVEKRKEVRRTLAVVFLFLISGLTYQAFTATNNIVIAGGASSADVEVKEEAPVSYDGIPYMERIETYDYTKGEWTSIGTFEISAYSELDSCHYPEKGGCLTASGKIAKVGMVATNLYAFRTRLMIDGQVYIVEDRISKKYNHRIDIFQGYGEEGSKLAKEFGIKHLEVKVLNN